MKWTWITALRTSWNPPHPNEVWSENAERNFTRLVHANAFHIDYADQIDMTSDIYCLVNLHMGDLEKELTFAEKVKAKGSKLIVCYSADLRFMLGHGLMNENGKLYTELCKIADVIISGLPEHLHLFGRYQEKVIAYGVPVERKNFSTIPYENRTIDILVSNINGEQNFSLIMELLLYMKERFPDKKIIYSTAKDHENMYKHMVDKIEVVNTTIRNYFPNARCYLNGEPRPRAGRALLEAFYWRVPAISHSSVYHARYFPKLTYEHLSMTHIGDIYEKLLTMSYTDLMTEAEQLAEWDYFDNFYVRLMKKLYE